MCVIGYVSIKMFVQVDYFTFTLWFKLPFRSQLINFLEKYFKEIAYIYIMINASNEGICVEF